jgi:protease-4
LIDHVGYKEQLREQLEQSLDVDTVNVQTQYGKNQVDTDFSGMAGFLKLMELMTGAKSSKGGSGKAKIALIYANGPIMTGSSQMDILGGQTLGSDTLISALQKAEKDDSVKGVVLRINSPGGSATASDLIWHALQSMSKPTVASMSDMAASGGYYIAMGCDRIVAQPSTLTGSIGVVGGKIAMGDLMDWVGLNQQTLSRGKNSGLFSADAPFTESEREVLMRLMEETYEQFTGKVAKCRKLDAQQMEAVAQGRIWTGRQAKEKGLVDELGSLRDAIDQARQLAGLPGDQEPELLILPEPRSFLEQLIEGPDAEEAQLRLPGGVVPPQWTEPLRQLLPLRPVLSEPVFLCVPFMVHVR